MMNKKHNIKLRANTKSKQNTKHIVNDYDKDNSSESESNDDHN
jgi:hypothetical protein